MMRTILQRLIVFSLALAVVDPAPGQTSATPVRIVTFNVEILTAPRVRAGTLQKYRFDYARSRHLERTADVIETLAPDVLNLIEATSREAVDQVVALLHEKGMTDYRGYHVESHDSFTGMDVALITRVAPDIVAGQRIHSVYSESEDPTWRQAFHFVDYEGEPRTRTTSLARNAMYFLTIGGHKLGFLGLHLKSNPQDDYANARRTAEAKVAQRALRSEIVKRGYTPVVLGDLNDYDPDVPDRDESLSTSTDVIARLKDFDPSRQGPELFNAAAQIVRREDRYSSHWDTNENDAHDPADVYTMIDHVLLPVELRPHVRRVFIAHVVGLETSDHYPVVVDLLLPPRE